MSVRKLWVVELGQPPTVIYSRVFPTVEKRARILQQHLYQPIPVNADFLPQLMSAVGVADPDNVYIPARDSCDVIIEKPIFNVGGLRPVLVVEHAGCLLCCAPLVEEDVGRSSSSLPKLLHMASAAMGHTVLRSIAQMMSSEWYQMAGSKYMALHRYITGAMPFGTPHMMSVDGALGMTGSSQRSSGALATSPTAAAPQQQQRGTLASQQAKTPAWRMSPGASPGATMGKVKGSLAWSLVEQVRCGGYDDGGKLQHQYEDVCEVYGTVYCKVAVEGSGSDVTTTINASICSVWPLDDVVVHPCVLYSDTEAASGPVSGQPVSTHTRKIRFSPPDQEVFPLCHYTVPSLRNQPPVRGYYQMKLSDAGDSRDANILIQLKLSANIQNHFQYFELHIPFYHTGMVESKDLTVTQGITQISNDLSTVVWNVGGSFHRKTLEASLNGVVKLKKQAGSASSTTDPFCIGQNAYVKIRWRQMEWTLSGCEIDSKSVSTLPQMKLKLVGGREMRVSEYKLWNSHGHAIGAISNCTVNDV